MSTRDRAVTFPNSQPGKTPESKEEIKVEFSVKDRIAMFNKGGSPFSQTAPPSQAKAMVPGKLSTNRFQEAEASKKNPEFFPKPKVDQKTGIQAEPVQSNKGEIIPEKEEPIIETKEEVRIETKEEVRIETKEEARIEQTVIESQEQAIENKIQDSTNEITEEIKEIPQKNTQEIEASGDIKQPSEEVKEGIKKGSVLEMMKKLENQNLMGAPPKQQTPTNNAIPGLTEFIKPTRVRNLFTRTLKEFDFN